MITLSVVPSQSAAFLQPHWLSTDRPQPAQRALEPISVAVERYDTKLKFELVLDADDVNGASMRSS